MNENIIVKGANTHNLKNIDVEIPKNKVVVFTGVSGSGKSSLVFDTVYTEAQRQLIDTFSSFARKFLPKMSRPPVEELKNISTAIIIDQKRLGTTLRSTVGTVTEIYTYLRLLFSRCGEPYIGPSFLFSFNHPEGLCLDCKGLGKKIVVDVGMLLDKDKSIREGAINHPDYKVNGWYWREITACGLFDADKPLRLWGERDVFKLLYANQIPILQKHGSGTYSKNFEGIVRRLERLYVSKAEDEQTDEKKNVYQSYILYAHCESCGGTRINERARSVTLKGKTLPDLVDIELTDFDEYLSAFKDAMSKPMVTKMRRILSHLIEIGVGYLSLNRAVATLSGGESQRVKMARQLDCDLTQMMYIMDEPTIGLHPRDIDKLLGMLNKLKEKGNSLLVVEHDPRVIESAEWIIDIGPKAGVHGGKVLFSGIYEDLLASDTVTARYLKMLPRQDSQADPKSSGKDDDTAVRRPHSGYIEILNARMNNLKNVSVRIPKKVLTCVTGVAGSGKSTLINDIFVRENKDCVVIDQNPIGKSSRSNPLTYIGVFDLIRKEMAEQSRFDASMFSFNSKGACPECKGLGYLKLDMYFLDDIKMTCDSCKGQRYTDEVLAVKYKGKNMYEILEMSIEEGRNFFKSPEITRRLSVLCDVGLEYLAMGQPLNSLSGGEAQRLKMASELHKKGNIYVMDEPTVGLHMADIHRLNDIIDRIVDKGNTVVVIEHNMELISRADWIIDLGPEGGHRGGEIIFEGTPQEIVKCKSSHTGKYLKKFWNGER